MTVRTATESPNPNAFRFNWKFDLPNVRRKFLVIVISVTYTSMTSVALSSSHYPHPVDRTENYRAGCDCARRGEFCSKFHFVPAAQVSRSTRSQRTCSSKKQKKNAKKPYNIYTKIRSNCRNKFMEPFWSYAVFY